jgi:hypothetical protein
MDLTWIFISGYALFLLVTGYLLPLMADKKIARAFGWIMVVGTVFISSVLTASHGSLTRMVAIVFLQLLSMKIVVAVESYPGGNSLTVFQWLAFALGWFGMRPVLFEKLPGPSLAASHLLLKGISRIIIGIFFLFVSASLEESPALNALFLPQLFLLVGLSLILHFGILNVASAAWRALGVDVPELFKSPYKSKSLKEFWGRRWNAAFSEMTALIAYRPLKANVAVDAAMMMSFLLSGLLHEIAISLPVRAGYGLPMIYFTIHAFAMHLEGKSSYIQKLTQHRFLSHVWVMTLLILPMPLLFHSGFVHQVLIPLRELILQSIHT